MNPAFAPIPIVEILGPAEQGISRPYKCRGEDGRLYYVKGRQTDRHSLWSEWLCGHLANAFGLKLPPFRLVDVPADLLLETRDDCRDIGAGIAFGSEHHPNPTWFEPGFAAKVPLEIQRDILMFDWWIGNMDRTRGNPNLLWDAAQQQVVVIDHNRAFDRDFCAPEFAESHIFANVFDSVFNDLVTRDDYAQRLSKALAEWPLACDNAPLEWRWANPERDVPANFDIAVAKTFLERCQSAELWRMV